MLAIALHSWLLHPTVGRGYNFVSGIGSVISEWLSTIGALAVVGAGYLYHHNCHEHRCWRLTWHNDKDGHPVCKVHHPDHPARGWFRRNRNHHRHASAKRRARERWERKSQPVRDRLGC